MDSGRIKTLLSSGDTNEVFKVGFLMVPNFSMLAFASAIEPLRSANRMSDKKLFEWIIASENGEPVMASNRVEVAANGDLEDLANCRMVFACSGIDVQKHDSREVINALRHIERRGAAIGAICTGTYLLARAGLLQGRRCTIHWENHDGLVEEFPDLEVTEDLFEIDEDRVTCSGGTASLDMMLHLIAQAHGNALAATVSEQFIHDRIRESHDRQRMELRSRIGVSHPKLLAVVAEMESNPKTRCRKRNCPPDSTVDTPARTVVPEISEHHANALLSQPADCPCTPASAPDKHVHPLCCPCLRLCFSIAFLQMLS